MRSLPRRTLLGTGGLALLAACAPGSESGGDGGGASAPAASEVETDPATLGDSPLLSSVRGDLLERAGQHADAAAMFTEAAARTRNLGERAVLQRRAGENRHSASGG